VSLRTVLLTPMLPAAGEQLLQSPERPVSFSWRWDGEFESGTPIQLEVEGPEKRGIPVRGTSQLAQLTLVEGTYRWRLVAAQTNQTARSETSWRSFTLVALAPPQPYGPREGTVLTVARGSDTAAVLLSWRALHGGLQAELELAPAAAPSSSAG